MAEALLGPVFENLLSMIQNEFATISEIKKKAEKLSCTLDLIKAFLEDAEEKQIANRSIKVWLQQLKDAVYVLDDILDECSIKYHRLGGLSSFKPGNVKFRYVIGNRLKEITKRFDEIAASKNKFVLQEGVRERPTEVAEWRQTSSIIPQSKIYGREDDKEKIVEFLLTQASRSDFLSIYPIVGLGGMGKTTIAQMVYNDDKVRSNFNIKVWICVSENFSIKRILCSIIESISREKHDTLNLDVIEAKVRELLQGKRYLLVLDDVWKRNQEMEFGLSQDKWNKLKSVLLCGSKGASILVSTRDMDVAAIMGTHQAHYLGGLSEDECWMLFKQYAFEPDKEERAELVAIGKEIVKKCGGSPLAAQALGGMLHSRSEEKEWLEVKESRLWNLQDESSILPALRLSYFHLTPTLRQCFAFCAIFPKDKKIMKEELIHLWIANGLISSRVNLEVEDVGNMTWNELYQKSFFQDMKLDDYSGDISFKMHDLVHDLAQSVMEQECMTLEKENLIELSRSTHHVAYGCVGDELLFNKGSFKKVESLRTLYQLTSYYTPYIDSFPTHRSLRVLRTSSLNFSSLEKLIHLRYLELYDLEIKTLPDSVYSLQRLEILKLKNMPNLICLPKHLSCLKHLKHLVVENCKSLSHTCSNIRKLSCLKTLSVYIVSLETGHTLAELHDLKLTGNLKIEGLGNVGNVSEAREANLLGKNLHELCLQWNNWSNAKSHPEQVIEALQPHLNLRRLRIYEYGGLQFPSWIGMLSSLVELQLYHCNKCLQIPLLGKLPNLRRLDIAYMYDLQYMDDDESYDGVEVIPFRSLEKLSLNQLQKLEKLLKVERGYMSMFPCLVDLEVSSCPKLVLPCLPTVKNLTVFGIHNELLRSISSFYGLTSLLLFINSAEEALTFLPEGTFRNLTYLQNLEISSFEKLKELPDELFNLNALEKLAITSCGELESLPEEGWEGLHSLRTLKISGFPRLKELPNELFNSLKALEHLQINWCEELECLPEQGWEGLGALRTMEISGFPRLKKLPKELFKNLNALEKLVIESCSELKCLPEEGWEGLCSLQTLKLSQLDKLKELPNELFNSLNVLKNLTICECGELESLPEQAWEGLRSLQTLYLMECTRLRSLPEGVRHLTSLQFIQIFLCPLLEERCKEGTGEDWGKIARVPRVSII